MATVGALAFVLVAGAQLWAGVHLASETAARRERVEALMAGLRAAGVAVHAARVTTDKVDGADRGPTHTWWLLAPRGSSLPVTSQVVRTDRQRTDAPRPDGVDVLCRRADGPGWADGERCLALVPAGPDYAVQGSALDQGMTAAEHSFVSRLFEDEPSAGLAIRVRFRDRPHTLLPWTGPTP
jgi:hypothetical protein